jgi:hypothetical protein
VSRLVLQIRFKDQATPPEGDPPKFTVHGESEQVNLLEGDASLVPDSVSFDTDVTTTGQTSFDESGVMRFGSDSDLLRFTTLGEGFLTPSPEEGLFEGSVIWRINEGEGKFAGATGLITSNFTLKMETGEAWEHQVVSIFLP